MAVYMWEIPESYPHKLIGEYDREHSPDRFLFLYGKPLARSEVSTTPIIKFEVSKNKLTPYDCLPTNTSSPIVNNRLAALLLEHAENDIQLFDVKIECTDGELEGYKLVNITHMMKGMDYEQSIYKTIDLPDDESMIALISKLVLRPDCMGTYQLMREEESENLLVSQRLYDVFKREKVTGVWLATPDEFYDLVHGK